MDNILLIGAYIDWRYGLWVVVGYQSNGAEEILFSSDSKQECCDFHKENV